MRWLAALAAASTTFTLHLGQNVTLPNAKVGDTITCTGLHGKVSARVGRKRLSVSHDYLYLAVRPLLQGGVAAQCLSTRSSTPPPPLGFEPAAVSFVSRSRGWELGRARCNACAVLRTTDDGGRTWKTLPALHLSLHWYGGAVSDVAFANARDGYLFGPALCVTHDGGRSWSRRSLAVASLHTGAGYAYALTPAGELWRMPTGSDDWRRVLAVHDRDGVELAVEGRTVAVLAEGYFGPGLGIVGSIWISDDAGRTWRHARVPCRPGSGGAAAFALTLGRPGSWLVDCFNNLQSSQEQHTRHRLYVTADGGRRWRLAGVPSHDGGPALLAATKDAIFLATEGGATDELHTSFDGGRTFSIRFRSPGQLGWADLGFLDDRTGFLVGPTQYETEYVYRTDDGGRRWRLIDTG